MSPPVSCDFRMELCPLYAYSLTYSLSLSLSVSLSVSLSFLPIPSPPIPQSSSPTRPHHHHHHQMSDEKLNFQREERILCFHGPLIYEAKVSQLRGQGRGET